MDGSNDSGLFGAASGLGLGLGEMFVNLSAEYPALLTFIFLIFGGTGVCIAASALFDLINAGDRTKAAQGGMKAFFSKFFGGSLLIDLAFWSAVLSDTLWSNSSPLGIESYTSSGASDDMWQTALMAVIGFIVLAGYVTLGRAFFMTTKLGYVSPDARSDIIGSIISRIFAGSAMICFLHIASAIQNSTGISFN